MLKINLLNEIQRNIEELKCLSICEESDFSYSQLKSQIRGITVNLEDYIEELIEAAN